MIDLTTIESTLAMAMRLSGPYLFAGLGGLLAQRAGVYNFGLEGMMLGGAFFGYYFALTTGNLGAGVLCALLCGLLLGLLLAFIAIRFGVSQLVICLGINTLMTGVTNFASRLMGDSELTLPTLINDLNLGPISQLPILGAILSQNILIYLVIILFAIYAWFIRRTPTGLSLRAVGESPVAAQTAGINVFRYRYLAVILSGGLAAMGGAFLTVSQVNRFSEGMTDGRGWIAVAAICLGRWSPWGTFFACILFGFSTALSNQVQVLNIGIPSQFAMMLPYVLAILALLFSRGKGSSGPAALGKPYMKNR